MGRLGWEYLMYQPHGNLYFPFSDSVVWYPNANKAGVFVDGGHVTPLIWHTYGSYGFGRTEGFFWIVFLGGRFFEILR